MYATCARKPRALTDLKALVESLATTVKRRRTSPVGRRPKLKVKKNEPETVKWGVWQGKTHSLESKRHDTHTEP